MKLENLLIMFNIKTAPSKGRKQNGQGVTLSKECEENCRHRSTMAVATPWTGPVLPLSGAFNMSTICTLNY